MKKLIVILSTVLFCIVSFAQQNAPRIIERGHDHRIWQTESGGTYFELASGMHYLKEGQWLETREEFQLFPGGAAAHQGPHRVIMSPNINSSPATDLETADGKRLLTRPMGLVFHDLATGKQVLVAEIKDSIGLLTAANVVVYPDSFTDFSGAVRYTYTRAGFEQDVILNDDRFGRPEDYGLRSESTVLEMWTEFLNPPVPVRVAHHQAGTVADETLNFGEMEIQGGKAFVLGDSANAIPTGKMWTTVQNRVFLIEAVAYSALRPLLDSLNPQAAHTDPNQIKRLAAVDNREGVIGQIPLRKGAQRTASTKGIERVTGEQSILGSRGVVLDYTLLNANSTNFTFRADMTYYVTGPVILSGNGTTNATIFESGAVIKFAPTNSAKLTITSPIQSQGTAYRPVVLTARDDHTIGEKIGTNSLSGYYAYYALDLNYYSGTSGLFNLQNFRISYASVGINFFGGYGHQISNVQLINCNTAYNSYWADVSIRNMLASSINTLCGGSGSANTTGHWEHVTLDQVNNFNNTTNCTFYLTNCLLVAVTNTGPFSGSSNASNTTSANVFQTVGAGAHYLITNSPYRNVGTTVINPSLASDLKHKTTYPPLVLTNDFTMARTLIPRVQRDIDVPDLGYHYEPLDYAWTALNLTNAVLTLADGVAIGTYGTPWLNLLSGATLVSEGAPLQLNRIVRYNAVQEQPIVWGTASSKLVLLAVTNNFATLPAIRMRFTDLPVMASDGSYAQRYYIENTGCLLSSFALTDCQLRGGVIPMSAYHDARQMNIAFTNNSWERAIVAITQDIGYGDPPVAVSLNMRNNLFRNSQVSLVNNTNVAAWGIYDNLFDNVTLTKGGSGPVPNSNNGYRNTTGLPGSAGGDVFLASADYQAGALGNSYYPATGFTYTLAQLINAGSRTADQAGLYHYTTTTNQVKEINSIVDIGFHFLALNAQNQPVDSDSDYVADWQEDINGNGIQDGGEFNWASADTDNDGDGLTNYQEFLLGTSPVRRDTDGNGVEDGDEDADGDLLSNKCEFNLYGSDPLNARSKHPSVTDAEFFHGAPAGNPNTLVNLSFPMFQGNNIHFNLTGATGVWKLYYTPNLNPGWKWRLYAIGNSPVTTAFDQLALGTPTGFFEAGATTDQDGDGLEDGYELLVSHSNINAIHTDGDGVPDNLDAFPSDPRYTTDTDGDGKPDFKLAVDVPGLPLLVLDDDNDNDGIPNDIETARNSLPNDPNSIPAADLFVKATTDTTCNNGNGLGTLDSPFRTIQGALDSAPAGAAVYTIIQVASGTYSGIGNFNLNFNGKRILLISEKGVDNTTIDCTGAPAGANAFIFQNNEYEVSRVIGFTIKNASGSAIVVNNGSPVISECVITNNATAAGNGGGITCNNNSSPVIMNCRFLGNGNAASLGGAIYATGTSKPRITHCTFFDNNRAATGGQINQLTGTALTLNNSVLWTTAGNNTELVVASGASADVSYCDIKMAAGAYPGLFCINADPLLEPSGRLTLTTAAVSPCIDVGTTNGIFGFAGSIPLDMDREARTLRFAVPAPIQNVLYSADIGADEFVYRLILPLDATSSSILDEASGLAFLGESGGLSKIAVVDDELDNDVYILHLNNQGLLDTASPFQHIITTTKLKDGEGITFVPNGNRAGLYTISSNTKRNWYHRLDNDTCSFTDPPTSDYDDARTHLFHFNINATFDWDAVQPVLYTSEAASESASVNYNATAGLIAHIRNQFTAAGAPFVADTTTYPYVMVAFSLCNNFSQPLDGTRYVKGAGLPNGAGSSLGDSIPANNELGVGSVTHDNTYLVGSLALNQTYWYRIWAFSQPGAVATRVYNPRSLTVQARTSPLYPKVFINEMMGQAPAWIELYNPAGVAVDISNYKMANRAYVNANQFYSLPVGTSIPARGWLVLTPDGMLGMAHLPFTFALAPGSPTDVNDDIYLSAPDGTAGTPGTVTAGVLGTILDAFVPFVDTSAAGTRGRIWDGACQNAQFGNGNESPASRGAANNPGATKLFDATSDISQVTPRIYLTYRNIGRQPAVWDSSPKQNDFRAINIEGFTYKPAGVTPEEMIIGLRSPLTARTTGNAIYFRAASPISTFLPAAGWGAAVAPGLNAGLDQLNLNGLGIRAITWYAAQNTYLIVAGTANGGPLEKELPNEKHVLYSWDGSLGPMGTFGHVANPIVIISDLRPYAIRPEGVTIITVNGQPRVMFGEDRFHQVGYATRNIVHWPISILGTVFQHQ